MIIVKEICTNRFYEFKDNKLITCWGNIYNKDCTLENLLSNGYKLSRKKELSDTSLKNHRKGMKRNNLPKLYGN